MGDRQTSLLPSFTAIPHAATAAAADGLVTDADSEE